MIDEIKAAGVDFDKIVMQELVDEGVKSFCDSYDSLLESIKEKAATAGSRRLSALERAVRRRRRRDPGPGHGPPARAVRS